MGKHFTLCSRVLTGGNWQETFSLLSWQPHFGNQSIFHSNLLSFIRIYAKINNGNNNNNIISEYSKPVQKE